MSGSFLEFVALAVALTGLNAVLLEILRKDPGVLREIVVDVEAMARPIRRSAKVVAFAKRRAVVGADGLKQAA